jgi:hypothetical protein
VHFDLFSIFSAYCLIFSFVHDSDFLIIFSLNLLVKKPQIPYNGSSVSEDGERSVVVVK